jgi:hypothetical protein
MVFRFHELHDLQLDVVGVDAHHFAANERVALDEP